MSSDRGTIPRGSAGIDQQSWAEPTLPSGRRLPSAPRERKPLLIVLALLLIIVGAGAAGLLVTRMSNRVAAIEVTQNVGQGRPITAADLSEVQITADSGVHYVSWSSVAAVVKYFAATNILAGTLLTPQMVSLTNNLVGNGRATVGLALKDGQMPDDLAIGQTVMIYSTATQTNSCGAPGQQLAADATVLNIASGKNGSGNTDVEVALDQADAGRVTCNTANGTAAIAITSGNG